MANSGLKKVKKLRKYINGKPTDEVKDNTINTEGYIADFVSKEDCPVGCDAVVDGTVIVQGTTTTTTTTTTAAPVDPILGRDYNITNTDSTNEAVVQYTDEYGETRVENITANSVEQITSLTVPVRISGVTSIEIEPVGNVYELTTTTTTAAPVQTNDFTIDTSSATESTVILLTQPGSTTPVETEIPAGSTVAVSSDITPVVLSGDPSVTVTDDGSVTFEEDEFTITNDDYYESTTVEFREAGQITDEIIVGPRETIKIKSQDTPVVTSGSSSVTVTAAGNASTPETVNPPSKRICNQNDLFNDSDYLITFDYKDCDLIDRQVTLEPGESVTVPSVGVPTIAADTPSEVGTSYEVNTIENDYGTSGTASSVIPVEVVPEPIPVVEPAPEPPRLNPYEYDHGQYITLAEQGFATDTKSKWYPKEIKVGISTRTGTFKFVSYDRTFSSLTIYRIYEGEPQFKVNPFASSLVDIDSSMRLDVGIVSDGSQGQVEGYNGLIDPVNGGGETHAVANAYAYGSKRVEPVTVSGFVNPLGYNEKTEFTLNKTTNSDYLTIRIYQPFHAGIANTSAVSYAAHFEIIDVT